MRKTDIVIARVLALAFGVMAAAGCGGSVEGLEPEMVEVQAGTFSFGSKPDRTLVKGAVRQHQLLMDSFSVSASPVSTELWDAVMGTKLSAQGSGAVSVVSAKDCDKFAAKLSKMTGKNYVIPTEQMWEYALGQGAFEPLHGASEWCSDYIEGSNVDRVVRTASERNGVPEYTKAGTITVRLAIAGGVAPDKKVVDAISGVQSVREHVCEAETVEVNGVKFQMVAVKGGSSLIGGTAEQNPYEEEDEVPPYVVNVEDFEIGMTEVTVAQWLAVMKDLPYGNFASEPEKPVINVSWYAAQEYILKLNELTGRIFRLPTEAEWEFAARGGTKTAGSRYSGSNQVLSVAVHEKNSDNLRVSVVKSLSRNELGIYDMSGNAWEWCLDAYAPYGGKPEDPQVKVMRGGSSASRWDACRVSNRSAIPADNVKGTFGFRLAI